jgi:hypothetical protein
VKIINSKPSLTCSKRIVRCPVFVIRAEDGGERDERLISLRLAVKDLLTFLNVCYSLDWHLRPPSLHHILLTTSTSPGVRITFPSGLSYPKDFPICVISY